MTSLISRIGLTPKARRITRNIARAGVVFCAAMLVLSVATALGSGPLRPMAAETAAADSILDTIPDTVPGTIPETTSTTAPVSTTTPPTTIPAETTTTIVAVLTPTTEPPIAGTPTPHLPTTGSSSLPIAIWAILLLAFGRMAILLARPLEVLAPELR